MKTKVQIGFTVFMVSIFAFADYVAFTSFARGAEIFPLMMGIPGLILSLVQLTREIKAYRNKTTLQSSDFIDVNVDESIPYEVAFRRAGRILFWVLGFYVAIWLTGFKIATIAFFILYLRIEAKTGWPKTLVLTAVAVYLIFIHFGKVMSIHWPDSLLANWVDWPWLFR